MNTRFALYVLFVLVGIPALFSLPAIRNSQESLIKRIFRFLHAFFTIFAGIVLPMVFFGLSIFLTPEGKDRCSLGWFDCFYYGKYALAPLVLWPLFITKGVCSLPG